MVVALVTAAGVGSRMNLEIPKQFLTVNDKPIIIYTLQALEKNPNIDSIIIACLLGWEKILESHIKQHKLTKVKWIVPGGETGQESITNCLDALRNEIDPNELVLIHDGNRPLVEDFVINESIRTCLKHGSAIAVLPTTEAILEIGKEGNKEKSGVSIDRDTLLRTQTPHTFPFSVLDQAYIDIKDINQAAVAACTVMIELGREVYLSPGSELNFKITTQEDLKMFTALVNSGYAGV